MTINLPKSFVREDHFASPIWVTHHEDNLFIDKLNKASDIQLKNPIHRDNILHSDTLINKPDFKELQDYVIAASSNLLQDMGYDLKTVDICLTEMWVQEFSRKGGGHHTLHTHWNGHISGFYFLKASKNTSKPKFHDPRAGAVMNQLPELNKSEATLSSTAIEFQPVPGKIIFFPSYLPHEYTIDSGKEPFRFIHFNCQALPKALGFNS